MNRASLIAAAALAVAAPATARHAKVTEQVAPGPVPIETIDAALAADRFDAARGLIERAKAAGQDGPALQLRLAGYWLGTGSYGPAGAAYEALTSDPALGAQAWQGAGLVALAQGRTAPAAAAFAKAVAADPKLARAWAGLAVTADEHGDFKAAEAAYAHAIALAPETAATWSNRGYSRILQARYGEAVSDLGQALKLAPGLVQAQNNRRLALAMMGDYTAAFAGADRHQVARDLNIVGFGAMLRGDYAAAEGYFTRAVETNPEFDRTAFNNLAYLKAIAPRADASATVRR